MLLTDVFTETYTALTANKARSSLTILGIVIGIGSVIAMIAVGRGAEQSVQQNIQQIGSNLLMVRPGAQGGPGQPVSQGQGSAQSLTQNDADVILRSVESIARIAPVISGRYQVVAGANNTRTSITGTTPAYADVRNLSMQSGTFLRNEHERGRAKVAVLGPDVAAELFLDPDQSLGKKVRVNGIDCTVIGVTRSKGGSGFGNEDDVVYLPLSTTQQYLTGNAYLSLINITVASQDAMQTAETEVRKILLTSHHIENEDDADFRIQNQADIVETATSVTQTFTLLLGTVAGISLIVGGIGIMNMMLTSVTERTREIGLRKAIGAKHRDISLQFLAEAVALTFIGGSAGIALGWGASRIIALSSGLLTEVSAESVALAFGVSTLIGIVFGFYPARRAASLRPIEALRYE